jgi:hypothetical protein
MLAEVEMKLHFDYFELKMADFMECQAPTLFPAMFSEHVTCKRGEEKR